MKQLPSDIYYLVAQLIYLNFIYLKTFSFFFNFSSHIFLCPINFCLFNKRQIQVNLFSNKQLLVFFLIQIIWSIICSLLAHCQSCCGTNFEIMQFFFDLQRFPSHGEICFFWKKIILLSKYSRGDCVTSLHGFYKIPCNLWISF